MLDLLAPPRSIALPTPDAAPTPASAAAVTPPTPRAPAAAPPGRWRQRFAHPAAKRPRGPLLMAVALHAAVVGAGLAILPPTRLALGEAIHGCLVVADASTPEHEPTVTPVAEEAPLPDGTVEFPDALPADVESPEPVLEALEPEPDLPDAPTDLAPPPMPTSDANLVRQRVVRPTPPVAPTSLVPVAAPVAPAPTSASAPSGRAQLRTRFRPAPPYPEALRQSGVEGVVALRIVIEADGTVSDAQVVASSGYAAFDVAAVETLRRWQFEPPGERRTVPSVPVRFRLS